MIWFSWCANVRRIWGISHFVRERTSTATSAVILALAVANPAYTQDTVQSSETEFYVQTAGGVPQVCGVEFTITYSDRSYRQGNLGVAASILEGLDEMLTVNRLGLPAKLRRSLACTNSIKNMMGTVRRVCRNVKRWQNTAMALRWTAAGILEAAKGFRRLKAYKHLPALRAALAAHQSKCVSKRVEDNADVA